MKARVVVSAVVVLLLAVAAYGQDSGGYLDIYIAKVKPEKRTEFDNIVKRMVTANRKGGDNWLASEIVYGDQNTVMFTSVRQNYGEIDKATALFMGAMAKAFGGPAGVGRVFQEFNNTVASTRGEVRRRRPDLTVNPPKDQATLMNLIGESRWVRTTVVRIRPGHTSHYEEQIRTNKDAMERAGARNTTFVSQSSAGQQGTVFYLSTLRSSLGGFDVDPSAPALPKALGQDGYQKYLQTTEQAVLGTESLIMRYVPELSNPPEGVVNASPEFWRPKPAPAAKKPAAGEAAKKAD